MNKHVFISYSRNDYVFCERLVADLGKAGFSLWVDWQNLTPGTPNFEQAIRQAIAESAAVVYVGTPSAAQSPTVQGELQLALSCQRPIVPLWASRADWSSCAPLNLVNVQNIDFRDNRYPLVLPALISSLKDLLFPPVAQQLPVDQLTDSQQSGRLLRTGPLSILVVRFARGSQTQLEWDVEDQQVEEMRRGFHEAAAVTIRRQKATTPADLVKVVRGTESEVMQFSGDIRTNSISMSDSDMRPQELARYLHLVLPAKVRLLMFVCCCPLSSIDELSDLAPYVIGLEAAYPSPAPYTFVKEFYSSYFRYRSVQSAYKDAKLQLEIHHLNHMLDVGIKRPGEQRPVVILEGLPDPLVIDLSEVEHVFARLHTSEATLVDVLRKKIHAHRALFETPRSDYIILLGPDLYGLFSWDAAAGYIRCHRLFRFRSDVNLAHLQNWYQVLTCYYTLSAEAYRPLQRPADPIWRTVVSKAVNRFVRAYVSLSDCIKRLTELGFTEADRLYRLGTVHLQSAQDAIDVEDLKDTVIQLESALTFLHDIVKACMPPLKSDSE